MDHRPKSAEPMWKVLIIRVEFLRNRFPMIFLTREGMDSDIFRAFQLGVLDCNRYPVFEAKVLSAVECLTDQVQTRQN